MTYPGLNYQAPGVRDANETFESEVTFGDPLQANFFKFGALIDGASRDTGHTNNTQVLRAGLLMGYHVANKQWVPYRSLNAANEGDTIQGVLYATINMQVDGTDVDRMAGFILRPGAPIKAKSLLTNDGTAGPVVGHAAETAIRTALAALGYVVDDWYQQ